MTRLAHPSTAPAVVCWARHVPQLLAGTCAGGDEVTQERRQG